MRRDLEMPMTVLPLGIGCSRGKMTSAQEKLHAQ